MSTGCLELGSSILTFAGGLLLTLEALFVRQRTHEESGARRLLAAMGRIGAPDLLKDRRGRPLSEERALQLWFAERSFRWAWLGFSLMSVGFLLEIAARFRGAR